MRVQTKGVLETAYERRGANERKSISWYATIHVHHVVYSGIYTLRSCVIKFLQQAN